MKGAYQVPSLQEFPMSIVAAFRRLRSACTVFFGPHGAVTADARQQGRSRQALYREADRALHAVDGSAQQARLALISTPILDLPNLP